MIPNAMFTGIVTDVGLVDEARRCGNLLLLKISSKKLAAECEISDSVSVNGVCLTMVKKERDCISFEAIASTLKDTNLKKLKKGDYINLETALKVGDKLGGHFVLGHIDCELKILKVIPRSQFWELTIDLPSRFRKYIIENGSIAVEGISLTVKKITSRSFSVNIIPFTYNNTTLRYKKVGSSLNVEFDHLLKKK
ncbi:MAG: riboflavin synthase [Candidatus Omnitrophica bacterium]|nr:riboflavin synthase [Candidatus Omnitrophota bacterium]MBD3269254.1 riboflavin synthase [Candidatus Omnitrophota bacterium]